MTCQRYFESAVDALATGEDELSVRLDNAYRQNAAVVRFDPELRLLPGDLHERIEKWFVDTDELLNASAANEDLTPQQLARDLVALAFEVVRSAEWAW
jgi:hypothetical protein